MACDVTQMGGDNGCATVLRDPATGNGTKGKAEQLDIRQDIDRHSDTDCEDKITQNLSCYIHFFNNSASSIIILPAPYAFTTPKV